ncbi:MAG: PolC-type DNA polymerase III [Lachnospiraceae bacterium]|nr:PolC-type DNA polymerase III [Lachnospiraceae bacterium]
MEKLFKDVFPTLKLSEELGGMLSECEVPKITSNRKRDTITVYIVNNRLLTLDQITKLGSEIRKQLFRGAGVSVKIKDSYHLSAQYNVATLWEFFGDEIGKELANEDYLLYMAFKNARINVDEESFELLLCDDIFGRSKGKELSERIRYIIEEKCGIPVEIRVGTYSGTEGKKQKSGKKESLSGSVFAEEKDRKQGDGSRQGDGSTVLLESTGQIEPSPAIEPSPDETSVDVTPHPSPEGDTFPSRGRQSKSKKARFGISKDPEVIMGKTFPDDEEVTEISAIYGEIPSIIIRGQIIGMEVRTIKEELTLLEMIVTDFGDSIICKTFVSNEDLPDALESLKEGAFIKALGSAKFDSFARDMTISLRGIKLIGDFRTKRMDNAPVKRVELHCHTKMSNMDAVCDTTDILKTAQRWGHPAIAITDHGVVQSFPDAYHAVCDKKYTGKVIYGLEAYLVDDLRGIVMGSKGQSLDSSFVVFDIETTGLSNARDKIIEIGAVKVAGGEITDRFSTFVNPKVPIPYRIEKLTSINDAMVIDADTIDIILPKFLEFCEGCVLVAHNAEFDVGFIRKNSADLGLDFDFTYVDTVGLARMLLPKLARFKLDTVAKALKIPLDNHHRAVDDAECTAHIFTAFIKMLTKQDITDLDQVNAAGAVSKERIRKLPSYHAIILAKNDVGRVNMYKLVSKSHLDYFYKKPLIPKSELNTHREGLILGSACEAGELFRAIYENKPEREIADIVRYYDYLEIQPIGNNAFLIDADNDRVTCEEDLREINRTILALGDKFAKPVVATCDVHFLNPEDEVYRRIIQTGNGFEDADRQAPLYFRTTEEMLSEFDYLGSRAHEVVIDNTNKIADMCEVISPVRPDKCPPVIENSDKDLTDMCHARAKELYGDPLPAVVSERLEKELNSIISNGYAVMYIIAQKLVSKSNEDGYLVGSRGSVGSSFVATMAGITEVNPLSPHYFCPNCHYSDFDSEEVRAFAGRGGCDMPDKDCPKCGTKLKKDGFDIPFETFLGFKGDKEPDIDLNFSGEYQAKAHKYTEVIFGEGHTFKAGTIGTLADKTVYGYVKHYYEDRGMSKRGCEIDRLVKGCVGVKRTTGQHPGGIVVLPHGEDINTFTPVQHPADDTDTDIITTHFDYHSIDHNLLKLDILGHDDPTMIRELEDLTGVNAREIPLDDKDVMSLFASPKALGITPDQIDGCPTGSLGIPEFGTTFVIDMLMDAKPTCFTDLVRIAGLGHGTDVWLGNAQTLIKEGKATISTAICTRDDIMTYLINKGLEPSDAFSIMENVRKGKVAAGKCDKWQAWKEDMLSHDVPDWYVWSCEKIKYMFPKAHAAAYVMMAWRIAWFKINYPLAYYAAYFGIRAKGFDYNVMCFGPDKLEAELGDIKKKEKPTPQEEQILKTGAIVREMYARGLEFTPIDIYCAKASRFTINDGKIMPSLMSISGMGDKAAEMVEQEAAKGPFLSQDDFRARTKVSSTITAAMVDMGILSGIPETNQLSLFDMLGE